MSTTAAGKIQRIQKNLYDMAQTLDTLSHGIQAIMSNQNNLNNRLHTLEKLSEGQETLRACRHCNDPDESDFDFNKEEETRS